MCTFGLRRLAHLGISQLLTSYLHSDCLNYSGQSHPSLVITLSVQELALSRCGFRVPVHRGGNAINIGAMCLASEGFFPSRDSTSYFGVRWSASNSVPFHRSLNIDQGSGNLTAPIVSVGLGMDSTGTHDFCKLDCLQTRGCRTSSLSNIALCAAVSRCLSFPV